MYTLDAFVHYMYTEYISYMHAYVTRHACIHRCSYINTCIDAHVALCWVTLCSCQLILPYMSLNNIMSKLNGWYYRRLLWWMHTQMQSCIHIVEDMFTRDPDVFRAFHGWFDWVSTGMAGIASWPPPRDPGSCLTASVSPRPYIQMRLGVCRSVRPAMGASRAHRERTVTDVTWSVTIGCLAMIILTTRQLRCIVIN